MKPLTREGFREQVFARDKGKCVMSGEPADCVHHIIERRLWDDGGYYLENGVSVSKETHILAEKTVITCEELRAAAGIKTTLLPPQLDPRERYDKWGNPYLNKTTRARGELFYEDAVQKILGDCLQDFTNRTKYPKTMHLPWSKGLQNDDRALEGLSGLEGEEVVATLKLDGENTAMARDYTHARSLDSGNHPSRNWVKALHGKIKHEIPEDFIIYGENCYAEHAIHYDNLPSYFFVFSIWEKGRRLAWDDTVAYCQILGIEHVPVLWRGKWNKEEIEKISGNLDPKSQEGLVVHVTRSISAGEYRRTTAKFVRKGHVQPNSKLWMLRAVVPNGLARSPEQASFLGRPPKPEPSLSL